MQSYVRSQLIAGGPGPQRMGEHLEAVSIEQVSAWVMQVVTERARLRPYPQAIASGLCGKFAQEAGSRA